jgi:tRNA(fMet)-specific endonuclease VapC
MDALLLDTDIVSYLLREDKRIKPYRDIIEGRPANISFATLAELLRWPYARNWGSGRIKRLEDHLRQYQVLIPDLGVCENWARVSSIRGKPINYHDAWIAATAMRYDLTLVTNNRKDFEHIKDLKLVTAS